MYRKIRRKMKQRIRSNSVNCTMTRKVIDLHDEGYIYDFLLTVDKMIICIQDNQCYSTEQLYICLKDICFDEISKSYRYIHTVETGCGDSGLLVTNCICLNSFLKYTPTHPFELAKSNNNFDRRKAPLTSLGYKTTT